MKLTKLLFPLITFIVIITSCGKDDLPTVDGGFTVKPSMLAHNGNIGRLPTPVVTTTVTENTVVVSWTAITGAVGYKVVIESIEKDAQGKPIRDFKQDNVPTSPATFTDIPAGIYTVKVKAIATLSHHDSNPSGNELTVPPIGVTPPAGGGSPGEEVPKAQLATPIVSASAVSYRLGNGNTSVSWPNVTNATGYSVTLNGAPVSDNTSPISLNLAPGTYTVGVTAKATGYPTSEEGKATIFVESRKPISTPVINGMVSYTAASAGTVSVTPLFIWPPNNKLTTVTFVGSGLSTGTGSISASHTEVVNGTDYIFTPASSLSNLAPGDYTFTIKAIAGGTYLDDNWVNSAVGTRTFTVEPGSLKAKLIDEYGVYTNPNITLTPSFTLSYQLMASRLGTDKTGRDYTFIITATNGANISTTSSAVSNVPHDQR